jgi:hypothetical protein
LRDEDANPKSFGNGAWGGVLMAYRKPVSPETGLPEDEDEILRLLRDTLRSIRYGSVLLTLHDGQVVELQKTEKIRTKAASALGSQKSPSSPTGNA